MLTSLGSGLSVKMKAQTIKLNNSEHQCRKGVASRQYWCSDAPHSVRRASERPSGMSRWLKGESPPGSFSSLRSSWSTLPASGRSRRQGPFLEESCRGAWAARDENLEKKQAYRDLREN